MSTANKKPKILDAQDIINNAYHLTEALCMALEGLDIEMPEKNAIEALCDEIQTKLKAAVAALEGVKAEQVKHIEIAASP